MMIRIGDVQIRQLEEGRTLYTNLLDQAPIAMPEIQITRLKVLRRENGSESRLHHVIRVQYAIYSAW